jgi:hypothetical protein
MSIISRARKHPMPWLASGCHGFDFNALEDAALFALVSGRFYFFG